MIYPVEPCLERSLVLIREQAYTTLPSERLIKARHVLLGATSATYHDYLSYNPQSGETAQGMCFSELCNNLELQRRADLESGLPRSLSQG
jgi:hypothetical protein